MQEAEKTADYEAPVFFAGDKVMPMQQGHGYQGRVGLVLDSFTMTAAAGIRRRKYTVQFPHSRTKRRTVELAMEATDIKLIERADISVGCE